MQVHQDSICHPNVRGWVVLDGEVQALEEFSHVTMGCNGYAHLYSCVFTSTSKCRCTFHGLSIVWGKILTICPIPVTVESNHHLCDAAMPPHGNLRVPP